MEKNNKFKWATGVFFICGMDLLNCSCEFYSILYIQSNTKISPNSMEFNREYCMNIKLLIKINLFRYLTTWY